MKAYCVLNVLSSKADIHWTPVCTVDSNTKYGRTNIRWNQAILFSEVVKIKTALNMRILYVTSLNTHNVDMVRMNLIHILYI
jgi:hypothetical protein